MALPNSSSSKQTTDGRSDKPKTPEEALSWILYAIEESGHESTFPEGCGSDFRLADASMFDPDEIENVGLKAPAYVGLDLETALDGVVWDVRESEYASSVLKWLDESASKDFKSAVEQLVDAELKSYGVDKDNLSFLARAGNISRQRAKCRAFDTSYIPGRPHFVKRGKEHEIEVHLEYLVGGHGGSQRSTLLYFAYKTPFSSFLKALQDATQLCTIPPIDFTKPPPLKPAKVIPYHPGFPRGSGRFRGWDRDRSTAEQDKEKSGMGLSADTEQVGSDKVGPHGHPESRRRSVRGYTLRDGPWIWKRVVTESTTKSSVSVSKGEIKSESDYQAIIQALREANKGFSGPQHSIMIWHSMDYEMRNTWLKSQALEGEERQQSNDNIRKILAQRTPEEVMADAVGMRRIQGDLDMENTDEETGDDDEIVDWMEMWRETTSGSSPF